MQIRVPNQPLRSVEADLAVLGIPGEDALEATLRAADPDHADDWLAAARAEEFKAKAGTALALPSFGRWKAPRILLVGTGEGSAQDLRLAAGKAGFEARNRGASTVALALGELDEAAATEVIVAFGTGNYRFDRYKAEDQRKAAAGTLLLVGGPDGDPAVARAILAGVTLARDLVNEPAAEIYPETLAARAEELAGDGLTVEVWDADRIREAGMGGITAVGQGSAKPARFIHMTWKPEGEPRARLALVGKGVTFDAGGLSLKPSSGMQTMRCDMAGGAAVIGAMRAIRDLRPDVEVHGIVGAVENMNAADSYKLGDILHMYNGKRVEIHNTDAEGRLVLADCLAYASELGVDAVVDAATLTGACVVALGDHYSGLFTDDDALAGKLEAAAEAAGEYLWRMPLPDWYKEQLKAEWGDIKNVGSRWGGAITAALFLREFVDGPAWAHVDIAGPAFLEKPWRHFAAGGTGALVPTLVRWITGA